MLDKNDIDRLQIKFVGQVQPGIRGIVAQTHQERKSRHYERR
jgi:hypothetical protein